MRTSEIYVDRLGLWLGRAIGLSVFAAVIGYILIGGVAMEDDGLFVLFSMIGAFLLLWVFVIVLIMRGGDE